MSLIFNFFYFLFAFLLNIILNFLNHANFANIVVLIRHTSPLLLINWWTLTIFWILTRRIINSILKTIFLLCVQYVGPIKVTFDSVYIIFYCVPVICWNFDRFKNLISIQGFDSWYTCKFSFKWFSFLRFNSWYRFIYWWSLAKMINDCLHPLSVRLVRINTIQNFLNVGT